MYERFLSEKSIHFCFRSKVNPYVTQAGPPGASLCEMWPKITIWGGLGGGGEGGGRSFFSDCGVLFAKKKGFRPFWVGLDGQNWSWSCRKSWSWSWSMLKLKFEGVPGRVNNFFLPQIFFSWKGTIWLIMYQKSEVKQFFYHVSLNFWKWASLGVPQLFLGVLGVSGPPWNPP